MCSFFVFDLQNNIGEMYDDIATGERPFERSLIANIDADECKFWRQGARAANVDTDYLGNLWIIFQKRQKRSAQITRNSRDPNYHMALLLADLLLVNLPEYRSTIRHR